MLFRSIRFINLKQGKDYFVTYIVKIDSTSAESAFSAGLFYNDSLVKQSITSHQQIHEFNSLTGHAILSATKTENKVGLLVSITGTAVLVNASLTVFEL